MRQVPQLSLLDFVNGSNTDQTKFVDNLFDGMKDYGFIILKEHTVDQKKIDLAYEIIHQFFSSSNVIKDQYILEKGSGQRGFTPFGREHAKDNENPDLKEFWHVGREISKDHHLKKYYPDNVWPKEIPEFKQIMLELYNSLDATARLLLDALSMSLDLPQSYFRDMIHDGNSILRLINYPPLKGDVGGSVRAAAHGDINLITLLVGATDSGLQLLDRDGKWLDVSSRPGEIVVDSGDMLSRITNDLIPTTIHRVVNPQNADSTRYSMPFFVHPHPRANLACLKSCVGQGEKYPPINSHDFLMQRLREIGLST